MKNKLYLNFYGEVNMAILQVRDVDDHLYNSLKLLAKRKRRSVSQEVIKIIEEYLSRPDSAKTEATEKFLNLEWFDDQDKSAEEIMTDIKKDRKKSNNRFRTTDNVFD